jgi:hypothetical protein
MTLPNIDNPFSVVGSDTMDANKVGKSSAFNGNNGLFAQLMQSTGVQQVAYGGSTEEFDLTLEMQDETVAHEAKMGEDHQKYDGLGLFSVDAASIETSRTSKKLYESETNQAGNKAPNADLSNGKDNSAIGQVVDSKSPELAAAFNPTEESGVDATRAANAAEALRAANAQVMQKILAPSRMVKITEPKRNMLQISNFSRPKVALGRQKATLPPKCCEPSTTKLIRRTMVPSRPPATARLKREGPPMPKLCRPTMIASRLCLTQPFMN